MLSEAEEIATAATYAAESRGIRVVVSVVDEHGNHVLLHRMDGAPHHSIDIAIKKAYTAASFGVETESLTAKVQPGEPLYGLAVNSGGRLIAFGGGAPVVLSSGVQLGVGISGGTTQEDIDVLHDAINGRAVARSTSEGSSATKS